MRAFHGALASLAVALMLVGISGVPAAAQERGVLIVTVSDSPDPAPSATKVVYAILVKNDGINKARNVVVTIEIPANTSVDKCNMILIEGGASTPCTPAPAPTGTVTVNLGEPDPTRPGEWFIRAHREPRINLTLNMPAVSAVSTVTVSAKANGDNVTDSDQVAQTTTVLPTTAVPVTFSPSGRSGSIACGLTLTPDFFQSDTTVKLGGHLGCTSEPYGLKITASGKTIDLNLFKIITGVLTLGSVGILVSNAADVTIIGGSTGGSSGIEKFDWCVKDEAPSPRLVVTSLRCFRARTAGLDVSSKKVSITGVVVDLAVAGNATTTAELPGGVGIRTRGDNTSIKDSIVRRTGGIGIWIAGTDSNGDGRVASIEGSNIASSTSKMRTENGTGLGLRLDGGPHFVKDVYVDGVYNDRDDPPVVGIDGVVVGPTGLNSLLDGVVVKQQGGHAFVVEGTGTRITNSKVDLVGLDGFVVTGPGSTLSGNKVQNARNGFIVTDTGFDTDLETNETEDLDGDGFVVDGDTPVLTGNSAQGNGGRGFVIGGDSGLLDTNTAQDNHADGFIITGNNNAFKNNKAENNTGIGFDVSGTGNDFNTNSASNNDGLWEWKIGQGQTQVGGKTNKVSGKTFCIPTAGGNINSLDPGGFTPAPWPCS
jgi:parallel beta-helix repeat protein